MTEIFLREKESNGLNIREKFSLTSKSILVLFILLIFICVGIRIWAEKKKSEVPYPSFISASSHGVAVAWGKTIYLLDHEGNVTGKENIPPEVEITQLKLVDNEIYIADVETKGIYKLKNGGLTGLIDASKLIHFLFKFSFNEDRSKIYIADGSNHRIHIFHADGKLIKSIGREGKEPGELKFPNSIVLTQDGNFLIVNTNAFRLDIYSPEGDFVKTYVDVKSIGKKYIPRRGDFIRELFSKGEEEEKGQYKWPTILTQSVEKVVFLLAQGDLVKAKLIVYDEQGQFAGELKPSEKLKKPVDVSSWEDRIVVTDEETRKIHLFNIANMSYVGIFSKELDKLGAEKAHQQKYYENISLIALISLIILFIPVAILLMKQRYQEVKVLEATDIKSLVPPEAIWAAQEDKKKMILACSLIGFVIILLSIFNVLLSYLPREKSDIPLVLIIALTIFILTFFTIIYTFKLLMRSGYLNIARRPVIEKILKAVSLKLKEILKSDENIVGCTALKSSRVSGKFTLLVLTNRRFLLFDVANNIYRFTPGDFSQYGYRNIKNILVEKIKQPLRVLTKIAQLNIYMLRLSIDDGTKVKELSFFLEQNQILERIKSFLEENRLKGEFIVFRVEEQKVTFKAIHPDWRGKAISPKYIAPILSAIFPGLGQFYNRQIFKGTYFSATMLFFTLMLIYPLRSIVNRSTEYDQIDLLVIFSIIICVLLFYCANIADAYRNSKENKL